MQLETKRLNLRPVGLEDAAYVLAQLNDPGWIKNIGDRNVHTIEEAENYINTKILPSADHKRSALFVAIRKDDPDKTIIGQCGIFSREGLLNPDLGFAFLENYCGKGYGYEAASTVLKYAQETMGITKVVAITSDENLISQSLLIKLGMKYTKDIMLPNIEGNSRYFEMM